MQRHRNPAKNDKGDNRTFQQSRFSLSVPSIFCGDEKNRPSRRNNTGMVNPICSVKFILVVLRTLALVIFYYCFSIGITFYQKWFIKDFHFPLTVVICHLVVKFILSGICRAVWEAHTGQPRVLLGWSTYVKQLAVTGVASALDIGFSNWSFEFITISLYTMTKSTCVIFILGFSLLLGLERKRPSLIFIVSLISIGLFMFTYKSTQFNMKGFLLVLSASFLAGLRWTLAQLVMQRKDIGLGNPVDMIYHVQPWMIMGLLPLAVTFEGIPIATSEKMFRFNDWEKLSVNCGLILFGSTLAFLMELSEYMLLTYTSSLTLSIAGIVKEVCTLYLAVNYNGDQMTTLNMIGLLICLLGISLHMILKLLSNPALGNVFDEVLSDKVEENTELLLASYQDDIEEDEDEDTLFDVCPVR